MNTIVLDTNIILSALFSRNGASFALLKHIMIEAKLGRYINAVSVPTILELEEVMHRGKHSKRLEYLSETEKTDFIDDIVLISSKTKLHYLWRPYLKDIKDDKILETAFNASAKYIVTYNIKDFVGVKKDFGIDVITPKAYLNMKGLV